MTYETEQQPQKFVFGDKEYDVSSLSPDQITVIQSIKAAELKIGPLQSELLLLSRGREALIEDLRQLLEE